MNTKINLSISLLLCSFFMSKAENSIMMDTVSFDLGQNRSIEFIARDFFDYQKWGNLDSVYALFLDDFNKMKESLIKDGHSNNLSYDYRNKYRKIQINSESSVAGEVSVDDSGNVIYFQTVEFLIGQYDRMLVKSPDLKGLGEIGKVNINDLLKKGDLSISPKGKGHKRHISAILMLENEEISTEKSVIKSNPSDIIELGMVFGLGTVRSVITPDIEFQLMVGLSKKGYIKHQFGLSNQWQFSFPLNEEGKTIVKKDGFLDLVYSISYKNLKTGDVNLMGVKAGTLVTKNSVNFADDVYRVALYKNLGKGLLIEGGIFMLDSFSEGFPYGRITWSW